MLLQRARLKKSLLSAAFCALVSAAGLGCQGSVGQPVEPPADLPQACVELQSRLCEICGETRSTCQEVARLSASDQDCAKADTQIADEIARLDTLDDDARQLAVTQVCTLLGPPR